MQGKYFIKMNKMRIDITSKISLILAIVSRV